MTTIYGLRAKGDREVRYVGMTNLPIRQALANHEKKARCGWHYGPAPWIARVKAVEIVRLCTCPASKARSAERRWVEHYAAAGNRLFNSHLVPRATGEAA